MTVAETGKVTGAYRNKRYTLVLDFEAIEHFELVTNTPLPSFLSELAIAQAAMADWQAERGDMAGYAGPQVRIGLLARLMHSGLRRHHPEVDLNTAGAMAIDPTFQQTLGLAVQAGLPDADGGARAEGNVPAPRSTGAGGSKKRSKRG